MNKLFTLPIYLSTVVALAQFYPIESINQDLKKDAYAVIRSSNTSVDLNAVNEFKLTEEVVISVLDKSGDSYVNAHQFYDGNTKIDVFEAEIFDGSGKSIKKFKSKDLSDESAVSGGQLYTDDRIKYLRYTPITYPYTVRYKITSTHKNTLFIPRWSPISYGNLAIESAKYTFTNHTNSVIRNLEKNLSHFNISKSQSGKTYTYELNQLKPLQSEEIMNSWRTISPQVIFATNEINIDGTKGTFDNWNDYGKWSYQNLINGKLDFNPTQKAYFKELVKDAKSDKEKVQLLYQHMQKKVRYIGVQLGIGGLSPFPNSYVESKSYGDCKALSNYFIGMLDAVGIKAYHTILYADDYPFDIDEQMMYQQGNHMIVYVPLKDEEIWIEATSQTAPFNYLGEMSGNRKVYIFDANGGKIIPSQTFNHQNNILTSKGKLTIGVDGKTSFELTETSNGLFYEDFLPLSTLQEKDQTIAIKKRFGGLSQPEIQKLTFDKDWENAEFEINLSGYSNNYVKKQGNNFIFNLIPINNEVSTLKKVKERNYDFHIRRGYTDYMEFEISIPENVKSIIRVPPVEIKSEFGTYQLTLEKTSPTTYILKRTYQQIQGTYDKSKYNDYVEFRRQVAANDNLKTLLEI